MYTACAKVAVESGVLMTNRVSKSIEAALHF